MLCIHILQQWFNLSDHWADDALYDSVSMRSLTVLDLGQERAPDGTISRFCYLLERHKLGEAPVAYVVEYPKANGTKIGKETAVYAK